MIFLSYKRSLLISISIHLLIFFGYFFYQWKFHPSEIYKIALEKGSSSSLQFHFRGKGDSKANSVQSSSHQIGSETIQNEILRIQNAIPYPESALQRGLESDCEWLVTVAENGIHENVETTRKCRYEIFNSAFKKIVREWKFQLPPGTIIRIPVSFRIVDKNE
ncbi:MAG: energy transducer TonB [Leptospiraceae bacterium]|nr:energy transducer TonB [Leptospiraceae bacterium]